MCVCVCVCVCVDMLIWPLTNESCLTHERVVFHRPVVY